ncbi:MAG: MBL fold metallo-hydrolase [Patescibacteria group bacterium]
MRFRLSAWGALLGAFLLLGHEWQLLPDGNLHVALLDIGQGDAILITTPRNQRILFDGGPDLTVLERLEEELPFFSRHLDLLILSHTDADHVTGLPEVMRRYDVDRVMLTGVVRDTAVYQAFLEEVKKSDAEIIIADSEHDLDFGGGVLLDVLWPAENISGKVVKEPNNSSIVAKLIYQDHPTSPDGLHGASILFTGDIEEKVEEELLKLGLDLDADILKVPHHGSKTSSSEAFLRAVSPELAVISVGAENTYGHPNPAVLARYKALKIPVRRTDREGKVEVVFE